MSAIAETERKHVVIIGGGFGGLQAARALASSAVQVTIIDRENHHLFQPLLYQVATAGVSPGEITVPIRSVFRKCRHCRVLLGEVVGADYERRFIHLENGERVPYDYLVVAAGAKTNYFGHDEWAEHTHGLKSMRDAIRLREHILMMFEAAEREPDPDRRRRLLTFGVIGGGPTGVELAGAISELGRQVLLRDFRNVRPEEVRVLLLEMADRVLLPFDAQLSERARRHLEELDVEVRTQARVTNVTAQGIEIGDEELIPASVVAWAPGVRPVSLADKLALSLDDRGRIRVDLDCSVPGHAEVFAIGDIASFVPEGADEPLPQLAPVAMQQGRHVARVIQRECGGKPRIPFRYHDKGIMAAIGRSRAVAQRGQLKVAGFTGWLLWLVVHVTFLIGWHNKLLVLFEWMWAYLTFRGGARLIVARSELSSPPPRPRKATEAPKAPPGVERSETPRG